jgi:ppGpp synthetase/RelA/SpoT-type nucleotidyltranferase
MAMELSEFLTNNRVDASTWTAANISWEDLTLIYDDHQSRIRQLEDTADFFVKSIQAFEGVHSVRWRVKSPEHLIEKIIRKRGAAEPSERYMSINVQNYHEVVTDLIGVRALHLFKDDCLVIHDQVSEMWDLHERAVSYIRQGDTTDFAAALEERDIVSKDHPAGYRSIHYVLKTKPASRETLVEVQVRTVFEEGWSEIDHKVRYPNFSKNSQVEDVLKVFNRLAGSADEMAGFIRSLSFELDLMDKEVDAIALERDSALEEMQKLLTQLADTQETKAEMVAKADLLQKELNKVKKAINQKAEHDSKLRTKVAINNPWVLTAEGVSGRNKYLVKSFKG